MIKFKDILNELEIQPIEKRYVISPEGFKLIEGLDKLEEATEILGAHLDSDEYISYDINDKYGISTLLKALRNFYPTQNRYTKTDFINMFYDRNKLGWGYSSYEEAEEENEKKFNFLVQEKYLQ